MTPLLITNSRLTCFRECPRKHKYQYVDGIRPVLDAEALTFGTLMHAALENWWEGHRVVENVGPSTSSRARRSTVLSPSSPHGRSSTTSSAHAPKSS